MGLPMAWNTEPAMMQKPASRKEKLMIRRAGSPMASMVSDASNRPSSVEGNSWKMVKPTTMMTMAVMVESRTVFHTRWGLAAP